MLSGLIDLKCIRVRTVSNKGEFTGLYSKLNAENTCLLGHRDVNYRVEMDGRVPVLNGRGKKSLRSQEATWEGKPKSVCPLEICHQMENTCFYCGEIQL